MPIVRKRIPVFPDGRIHPENLVGIIPSGQFCERHGLPTHVSLACRVQHLIERAARIGAGAGRSEEVVRAIDQITRFWRHEVRKGYNR